MDLTKNDVLSLYEKIKTMARKSLKKEDVKNSLKHISVAANVAYLFGFIYKDDELESMLSLISRRYDNIKQYNVKKGRYLMIDSFGNPNRGLTQQYLRGLISMNVEFLYISVNVSPTKKPIYDEVELSANGILNLVPDGDDISKMDNIYNKIAEYQPEFILAHISPWDVVAITILYAFSWIKRYNINLTDHAFWLGAGCFNYNFEFRHYGATVSSEKRGFLKQQILLNPFYPIVDDSVPFLGFPNRTEGKVILFSGGDYYKIYGNNMRFLFMMESVLKDNPETVLLFAGKGLNKAPLERFLESHKLKDRFILLGERKDINQVFNQSDIYLGTYPKSGGLMTQLAVYNGKPVVAFSDSTFDQIEDIVFASTSCDMRITFTDIDEYYIEIKKLVQDILYRKERGSQMKNALRTKYDFDSDVNAFLNESKYVDFSFTKINYDKLFEQNLKLNNETTTDLGILLFKNYKLKAFMHFFTISMKYFKRVLIWRLNFIINKK